MKSDLLTNLPDKKCELQPPRLFGAWESGQGAAAEDSFFALDATPVNG